MFNDVNFRDVLDHVSDGVYVMDPRRNILYWNLSAERLTGYAASEVVGRSCRANILVHADDKGHCLCEGQCPVAATLEDGQTRQAEVFLHHKDGHRVPVHVDVSVVRDEAGRIVAAVETFHENSALIGLRSSMERLKQWAVLDLETGMMSRRATEMRLQSCIEEIQRYGGPFGIMLAEIDSHTALQREHSPDMLVRVRRMVGRSLLYSLRSMDTVGRWSDNQFLAIVPHVSDADLQTIGSRARAVVDASFIHTDDGPIRTTVSIGATTVGDSDTIESTLRRAEVCLLASRSSGRNRVTVFGGSTTE